MAGAPDRADPRTVLEFLAGQRQQTWVEISREIQAFAIQSKEPGTISDRHLGRLARNERSTTRVQPATGRLLEKFFGHPVGELLRPFAHGDIALLDQGTSPTSTTEKEVLAVAAQRARKFLAGHNSLTAAAMEQIYEDVRHLALAYPQRPLAQILGSLSETQDTLFTLLENRQRPEHARQLYFLAGVIGGLLAKASHDLADSHTALTQARTAFLCADQADHNGLRAWIRGLQSLIAYWAGQTHQAVQYAQQGNGFAVASRSTTAIWLPVSEARAWAALGNANQTRLAIQRAEEAWSQVQPDDLDELGGICTFSRSRQLYYAADALAWLPVEADAGERYAAEAVEAYQDPTAAEWSFGDKAGSHADLAIARIATGELDGATEALAPVLELAPEQRINGILSSARRVHRALTMSAYRDAGKELQEAIEVFTSTPPAALPR